MNLGSPNSLSSVDWMQGSQVAEKQQPLTWYKVWGQLTRKESFTQWFLFLLYAICWGWNLFKTYKKYLLTFHLNLQTHFDAPEGEEPLALDMTGMGKGLVWINGQSIGRYWNVYARGNCSGCSYSDTFRPIKCQFGCGHPTQQWYGLSQMSHLLLEYKLND